MTDDRHVDGNALGAVLMQVFGREMTDARACCAACGAVSPLGALIAFTRAPGQVLCCPGCDAVTLVVVPMPTAVRISFVGLRWLEPVER